jgi:hypothetical protein
MGGLLGRTESRYRPTSERQNRIRQPPVKRRDRVYQHPATPSTTPTQGVEIMASASVSENPSSVPARHYETASLRLTQAVALIRIIGIAVQHAPSEGLSVEDASGGVIHLLEEASELFQSIYIPVST